MTTTHEHKPAAACHPQSSGVLLSEKNVRTICQYLASNMMHQLKLMHFLSPTFEQEFLMGTFATDWAALKTIIKDKDDAIAAQQTTISTLQGQVTTLQGEVPDAADLAAMAEVDQVVKANTPSAAQPAPPIVGQ
jgi:hypothetical protein